MRAMCGALLKDGIRAGDMMLINGSTSSTILVICWEISNVLIINPIHCFIQTLVSYFLIIIMVIGLRCKNLTMVFPLYVIMVVIVLSDTIWTAIGSTDAIWSVIGPADTIQTMFLPINAIFFCDWSD